uniref:H15 domain-containing protein n=1 Tax=Arion vulgaris TaxID=1028688 RepID=A0A0B7B3P5_9EUPU
MPAIKKKWIKASQDGGNTPEDENDDILGDEDKEHGSSGEPASAIVPKAKKRPHQPSAQHNLLRGLDGEVLSEKRKRFIPPTELKLTEWLDNNLEARTEETLCLSHLYRYYTELCQGDGSEILDVPVFNRMVKEKFGKSFGVKETSVYKSLIKEKKINQEKKKTGSGIKLKEIVHEAINHFGNPWGGVRFFALKQYIGTKYPAIQIDQRPKLLKRTLEMGTQYGQIDLVKGIGMAGFYKLPGGEPPPKTKPKSKKEEGNEKSADDTNEAKVSEEEKEDKPEDSTENGEKKDEVDETKKKKKHKLKKIEKISFSKLHHGNPEKMEDIFPLAITYQSAPKSASVPKIRRYIEEKYRETVQDGRWRKAIESGAEKGYWEHFSGSGITGSLHLLMDDFNPGSDQIEDMICAAIIACHEPKSASASQIKKYVSQYHPEFKVDDRPDKFKKALLRAVSKNMIVQLSGLGANGSFQLSSSFTPTPAVLAGEDGSSEEEGYDSDEPAYVPRGTKSRGVPKATKATKSPRKSVVTTKVQKKSQSSKGRAKRASNSDSESSEEEQEEAPKQKNKRPPPKGRQTPVKASSEQANSSDEDKEPEYTPRKSQSRSGVSPAPVKQSKKKAGKASKGKKQKSAKKVDTIEEESSTDKNKGKKSMKKADSFDEESPVEKEKSRKPTKKLDYFDEESTTEKDKAKKSTKKVDSFEDESSTEKDKKRKFAKKADTSDEETSPSKDKVTSSSKKAASVEKEEPAAKKGKKQAPKVNKISVGKTSSLSSSSKDSKPAKSPKETIPAKRGAAEDSDEGDVDSVAEPEYTPRKSKSRGGTGGELEKKKGKASRSRI